ncbi:uncharacterized protein B0I36DRAFT_380504 [Microdochium trichocladiopsis]|uniref:LysM domain-containing protein n=1 Tax=Microdochium trichocladiopsis TaxID=1682393 RepID=A0A9P8YE03_9PEZI|nr:uncharacterized protein B0I36DRAFT_380504 [Microdochium trichocladiopsis]KAH7037266.1 hypothetical protein B0I36DRAFT_380504 [Microdochium trichocladiopsis]
MLFSKVGLLVAVAAPGALAHVSKRQSYPYDPNTTPYCTWWYDVYPGDTCRDVISAWGVSMADFVRWNPSLTSTCGNFKSGTSYCIEALGEPPVTSQPPTTQPPTTTKPSSTTSKATSTSTSTKPGNGIETPSPVQDGITGSCNKFHYVETGSSCQSILTKYGLNIATFYSWNKAVGSQCESMWAEVYVCVGVIGGTPTSAAPTTSSKPGNGIATPTPIQEGMTGSCNKFTLVKTGDTCDKLASAAGISTANFITYNPAVGKDCSGLWANVYVCVGIIGSTPTPSPTTTGNGIATPTPTQGGMIGDCDKFDLVKQGESCSALLSRNGLTIAQLYALNSGVGSDCSGLWANVYVCVHKKGTATTKPTTTTGNGIATPTPTQTGMVNNCKKFVFVQKGQTCETVAKNNGISVSQLTTWNKDFGSTCSGMWAETYACVGV